MKTQKKSEKTNRTTHSRFLTQTAVNLVFAGLLALPIAAWAQVPEWTVYNTGNSGLPYNGVTALAIDAQENVWVGTGRWYAFAGGGLAKFDGQNWTVYNTANSGLPNNDHISLSIDPQGNIWSGTESGVSKFDGEHWTVYLTSNSGLPNNQAGAPVFDNEGNAWIGTTGGLAKYDGANWTVYNTGNSGLPNHFIWPMTFDGQGNLWIGTFGSGLAKYDGANWTVYSTANSGLPDNNLVSLAFDLQGNVWIGTLDNGLAKFDGTNWVVYNTANSVLPNDRIWYLGVDAKGGVWACTLAGLARFDGARWTVYTTTNSGLPNNNVYCVAFDAEGAIWVGTQDGGLAVFRPRPVVDFNGNGTVDINDLLRLIKSWGQNDPSCDIGPNTFGDGIVDEADLEVLMSYWGQDVQDGTLIAHWKLDETEGPIACDSAGQNEGTVIGVPAWQSASGAVDGALEFNGTTFVVADSVLNPKEAHFSAFAWVKGGAAAQTIISQQAGYDWLMLDPATGALMTELRSGGRQSKELHSDATVSDGAWHRIGFTWDGANRRLYVDDVLVAEDTDVALAACSGRLNIGCGKLMAPTTFFTGQIDDVRLYNRAVKP